MAIQQNINQLLGTASIAAGLYAHQPNVQKRRAEKAEYKKLSEDYDPKTMTMKSGREGVSAEKGFQKAGYSPEEAAYKSIPYKQEELESLKRLAELETDPAKKQNLYEDIGYSQGLIETNVKDYEEYQSSLQQKQEATAAKAEEAANIKAIRDMILHGTPAEFEQPTKREVIKYGK